MSQFDMENQFAPVVLFVYNRPVHTRSTVEALAKNLHARDTSLWIFSDGPRSEKDESSVNEVRRYINSIDSLNLFKEVAVKESINNKGLANSIIGGVSQVVEIFGRIIVLEDDLVTSPDFIDFMNACLNYYESDKNVGSISGYSPIHNFPGDYNKSVYLIPRSSSLGWATWKNRWQQVDWDVSDFPEIRNSFRMQRLFNRCGSDRYDRLRRQVQGNANSWSIRFGYWQFRQGMNTLYSSQSRILNIGNDGTGTHDASAAKYNENFLDRPEEFNLVPITSDNRIIRQVHRVYSGSFITRLGRLLKNYLIR